MDGESNFHLYPTISIFCINGKSACSIQENEKDHFIKTFHD